MAYAITQGCCNDASCVSVCPVNCIHPTPGEPDFGKTDILYVDPKTCIDCGACADACPVSAIKPIDLLSGSEEVFAQLNADYYEYHHDEMARPALTFAEMGNTNVRKLRVAIVGTGPAASYTARTLLTSTDAKLTMLDKSPVPGGLVRSGVAPDHGTTKSFTHMFDWAYRHPRTTMYMNVEVGRDITHEELMQHHDAVIYGVGARRDRELGVPGEELDGVYGAPDVVAWYNGDVELQADSISVAAERVVVVGNGNVALDIARILLSDPDELASTEIADHALVALAGRQVREVILLGRRGPAQAAFTRPELLTMPNGIDVVVATDEETDQALAEAVPNSNAEVLARLPRVEFDWSSTPEQGRRLVFAFGKVISEVHGTGSVDGVSISPTLDDTVVNKLSCEMVVRSTGHRGSPIADLPFDEISATVPNKNGRVIDPVSGEPVPGAYVVGWIKRGANGGIGANRDCAHDTVSTMIQDARDNLLSKPRRPAAALRLLLMRRVSQLIGMRRMYAIDQFERDAGARAGRPRVKLTTVDDMLAVDRSAAWLNDPSRGHPIKVVG